MDGADGAGADGSGRSTGVALGGCGVIEARADGAGGIDARADGGSGGRDGTGALGMGVVTALGSAEGGGLIDGGLGGGRERSAVPGSCALGISGSGGGTGATPLCDRSRASATGDGAVGNGGGADAPMAPRMSAAARARFSERMSLPSSSAASTARRSQRAASGASPVTHKAWPVSR